MVQVCDFNLARALKTDMVEPSATLNSPAWSAPERLQGKRYGKSADVFSFGVILWELITLGMHCSLLLRFFFNSPLFSASCLV